jgi:hypothetical protein
MTRWCKRCNENTEHDAKHEHHPLVRGFFAITTMGASEVVSDKWWECQKCGKRTKR